MALPWAKRVVLERKIARWVWEEKRAITLPYIAEHLGIDVPSTRKIVRSFLRRTDGIKCSLEVRKDVDNGGNEPSGVADTYVKMMRHNVDLIADSLK
ncbi:hypothetical protein EBP34_16560 [Salmonella enterica subsp. enterica serovar Saintpaul]|nr:hypothetical protein [Salmonella enterica subsp. enterica serovar Saintpaul]EFR6822738.1 hypothetical protein [Salmonella enterica]EHF6859304.1 hypothetical protein [Salmonella enterica subsp. enterica serovar Panama]ELS1935955.1 hypothetical protein [Salmonella enterica]